MSKTTSSQLWFFSMLQLYRTPGSWSWFNKEELARGAVIRALKYNEEIGNVYAML